MRKRLSVNATQVPQGMDLASWLMVIGNWVLVGVALFTVYITAWQTRRGQRLLNKKVEESIAQTNLQQNQFGRLLEEQERPRIAELIRKVLTDTIGSIEYNNQ